MTITHEKHRRYFIGRDNSGHRYLVPYDCRKAWEEWIDISEDDERGWEVPDEIDAMRIDGSFVHFCCPTVMS